MPRDRESLITVDLREVVRFLPNAESLNDHPWTQSLFVQDYVRREKTAARRRAGPRLAFALAEIFLGLVPDTPPEAGKEKSRLNVRWGRFGMVGAYFVPILVGQSVPATTVSIGNRIDRTLAELVARKQYALVDPKVAEKYALMKKRRPLASAATQAAKKPQDIFDEEDVDLAGRTTFNEWFDQGLRDLARRVIQHEEELSIQQDQPSPLLTRIDNLLQGKPAGQAPQAETASVDDPSASSSGRGESPAAPPNASQVVPDALEVAAADSGTPGSQPAEQSQGKAVESAASSEQVTAGKEPTVPVSTPAAGEAQGTQDSNEPIPERRSIETVIDDERRKQYGDIELLHFVVPEWQFLLERMAASARLFVQGTVLAGKSLLARTAIPFLRQHGFIPLRIDVSDYARHAHRADLIRYAVEHSELSLLARDPGRRTQIEELLVNAEIEGRLIILADDVDAVPAQDDIAQAVKALERYKRVIVFERCAFLPFNRAPASLVALPLLSFDTSRTLLSRLNGDDAGFSQWHNVYSILAEGTGHLGWLNTCARVCPTATAGFPAAAITRAFVNDRAAQIIPVSREDLFLVLRTLAFAMEGFDLDELRRPRLDKQGLMRAFRHCRIPRERIEQLIDQARQIGFLDYAPEGWGFAHKAFRLYLAAEYFAEREGYESYLLQPGFREAVAWGCALMAMDGRIERLQRILLEARGYKHDPLALRSLDIAAVLAALRFVNAPFVAETIESVSPVLQHFAGSESQHMRIASRGALQGLGLTAEPPATTGPIECLIEPAQLGREAGQLDELLTRLGASPAKSVRALSANQLAALVEGVRREAPWLARQCAAWLVDAPLDTRIGSGLRLFGPPAHEVLAQIAADPGLPRENRDAALSAIQRPQWIAALAATGKEEFLPILYTFAAYPGLNRRPMAGNNGQWACYE